MPHIRVHEQVFQQIERGRVEPLQIVEEQGQWMLRPGEHRQEAPEHQLKASLRILRWQLRNCGLLADDEFQFRNQVHHELAIWTQRFAERRMPGAEFDVALRQQRTDQALKSLRQSGIGNVALVLVELAGSKQPARRHQDLVQFVHDGGLADPGVAGHQDQLHRTAPDDAVEGAE